MHLRIVSSLEKVFSDQSFKDFPAHTGLSALRGERVSFQVAFTAGEGVECTEFCTVSLSGALAPLARVRRVKEVPVEFPIFPHAHDENYLRKKPGLYPDMLQPMSYVSDKAPYGAVRAAKDILRALWIDFTVPSDYPAGSADLVVSMKSDHGAEESVTFTLDVIPMALPEQKLIYTEWFHCDGLAQYYRVPVWSDEHFRIISNFARTAAENGINMLLVPVFTPPLDTEIGGERLTTQLVKVEKRPRSYRFDFKLLDRYLDVISEAGIEYYEISHLFSQWGATAAPKVMATVDGKEVRLFGWETDSHGKEYTDFLRSFLKAFLAHMKERGEDKKCFFHISDEPQDAHLESYKKCKEAVADLLEGYTIMDALSNFDYYRQGIVETPIPCNNHIEPFLEAKVPGLWTYYCCGQCVGVSNRLISMPSWRNRAIGMQMYRYDIVGFLQWGYNFYNNCYSHDALNPFADLSGEFWVPAGDTFSVYPGADGEALESLRLVVFYEAIADMRAMKLCESLCGKEETLRVLKAAYGKDVLFSECPHSAEEMLRVRRAINEKIREYCK